MARTLGAADTFCIPPTEYPSPADALRQAQGERQGRGVIDWVRRQIHTRGADIALVAAASAPAIQTALDSVRPAGRVVLFAQTRVGEMASVDVGQIGKLEKDLVGSYSASIDLQAEAARLVFTRTIQVAPLITHRFPLDRIQDALAVAMRPSAESLKVIVAP